LEDASTADLVALSFIRKGLWISLLQGFKERLELFVELGRNLAELRGICEASFTVWLTRVALDDEILFKIFFVECGFL
jgi:hypothetical protein